MIKSILKKAYLKLSKGANWRKESYAQTGEDLIIKFIFKTMNISNPGYIDIGAHHPYFLNNTALFYSQNSIGINIEPDPSLFKEFIKYRPHDINLNIGVSDNESELEFYIFNVPTLNTFSREEAEKYKKEGNYKIIQTKKVQVKSISSIVETYCNGKFPELLTIDAEGVDEIVLKSIDYTKNYPLVICVETISFSASGNGEKNRDLIKFLESNGYFVFADTYINSIFVRKDFWSSKKQK